MQIGRGLGKMKLAANHPNITNEENKVIRDIRMIRG
jgi:hypothetical protein